jgi:hypothetical protein
MDGVFEQVSLLAVGGHADDIVTRGVAGGVVRGDTRRDLDSGSIDKPNQAGGPGDIKPSPAC